MDLKNFLAVLVKRKVMIVVVMLVCVVVGAGVTLLIPPTYRANTELFVSTQTTATNSNQQLYQGASFSVDRVKSYAELTASSKVLAPVVSQLGRATSPADLAGQITTTVPADTVLLDLEVTGRTPDEVATLANRTADQLARVIEEIETPATGPPSPVRVTTVTEAVPPSSPIWPSLPINLVVGVLAGLVLGIGLTIARERLDVTVKCRLDLARVSDLPLLATVPLDPQGEQEPVVRADRQGPRAEAFRQLRTNLQFAFIDVEPGVLAVTSAVVGEGKSSVCGNLATSLRQLGSRVCLVDGDLRRPSVAEYFGLVGEAGLTTVLIGRATVGDVIQTAAPGLDVITSGTVPPNPTELLASGRMAAVLSELDARYDIVIVDASPALPVADAAVIANLAGGVLFVVRVASTTRLEVELAMRNLERAGSRLLGVVLNMAQSQGPGYGDYPRTYRPDPGRPQNAGAQEMPVSPTEPGRTAVIARVSGEEARAVDRLTRGRSAGCPEVPR